LTGQLANLSSFLVEMVLEVAESRKQSVRVSCLAGDGDVIHIIGLGDDCDTSAISNSIFSEKIRDIGGGLFLLPSSGFRSKIVDEAKWLETGSSEHISLDSRLISETTVLLLSVVKRDLKLLTGSPKSISSSDMSEIPQSWI
jgi:hypothetical protein